MVDSDCGLYCWDVLAMSSGQDSRKLDSMALVQVYMTGEKRAAL